MMWLPLTLLVLAGIVAADHQHGWKVGDEYTYLVRSRTVTGLDGLSEQYSGLLIKGIIVIQVKDSNTLLARLTNGQHARIHKELPNGWDSEISDDMLELRDLPLLAKPFEIKIKHGVIRDLIVEKDIPTWELNMLKSIVSQLQIDTQGENVIRSNNIQIPRDDEPYGSFKAMEDSVGGKCEVLYDITPLPDQMIDIKPELVPMPHLKGNGQHIDILKTKNFDRCDQRMNYHYGITEDINWEPGSNDNGEFLSKSASSRMIISGDLKQFTIQSAVTTSKMFVSPRFYDFKTGIVVSKMNLTLANLKKISRLLPSPNKPESTGNLVYVFDNPFSDMNERRVGKPSESLNSKQVKTPDSISSVSSSEEFRKDGLNLRDSSQSSDSSRSISSSEENDFWQLKPTLEEAPRNPLLPNFVGYKGKVIGKSDKLDLLQAVKELVSEIATELEDPSNIPTQETLEKFTILSSLIRIMDWKQIKEIEGDLLISPNEIRSNHKLKAVKQNAWAVFRDAITQAGTGPAWLTIKSWIEKEHLKGWEAADVISRIPKNARLPTAEFVKSFFELATSPLVVQQKFLNATAILSFAELVRISQISKNSLHNRYPVHVYGRLTSKYDQTVVQEYIPYLERALKDAIRNRDSEKTQTYTLALGLIGHTKILSIFEPYLEGKEPTTVFQRLMIVASLSKLAELSPKVTRSVLYKIYLNTLEVHDVRCAAVFLLMKTNPPLSMLQRMAEFTNYDTNNHVNSAVKSILRSLAGLTNPESQDLANKARAAINLLNTEEYGYQFSRGYISDSIVEEQNLISRMILNYIGSDDNLLPRNLYYASENSYGDFKTPATELTVMLSSVRQLIQMAMHLSGNKYESENLLTEQIAEALNIVPEEPIRLEGNLFWNSKFNSRFLPFDDQALRRIPSWFSSQMLDMKNGGSVNLNKLSSYDITLGFPTETGLPFIYTFRVPILYKLSSSGQIRMNPGWNINLESDVRLVYSRKIQGRVGFVAPFEHQHFIAGVDANVQVFAPLRLSLDLNSEKKDMTVKVWPLKGDEKAKLIHYSVVPHTSVHDILNLRPLLTERNTRLVHRDNPETISRALPTNSIQTFKIDLEADKSNEEFWNSMQDESTNIFLPWSLTDGTFCKMDLYMNLKQEVTEPLILKLVYDSMDVEPNLESSEKWTPLAKALEPQNKEANSEDRRKQFLKEATKGIKAAKSHVVDLELKIPGSFQASNLMTLAWSMSNVDNKARVLSFWRINTLDHSLNYEVCTAAQGLSTLDSPLFYEKVIRSKPKVDIDVDIRYGNTCSEQLNIRGKAIQSDELKEELKDSPLIKKCEEQMKHGNKILSACQNAASDALTLDEVDITVDVPSQSMQQVINFLLDKSSSLDSDGARVNTVNPRNADKDKIDIKLKLSKDLNVADVSVHTWTMDMWWDDIRLSSLATRGQNLLDATDNMDTNTWIDDEVVATCMLDKTRAETFDGKEYPLRLGKCWHVVMTTYPKINPDNLNEKLRIPKDESVTILSRETDDGHKEVKILLGQYEIKMLPGVQQPEITVDGRKIELLEDKIYQERKNRETVFEIYKLWDDSIGLVSDMYEVELVSDGKRILIEASDKYRRSVRGLCGNFDGDVSNDFMSPKSCIMRKPDEFIATYALIKDQCEGVALENAKSVGKFECKPQKTILSNVISDVEAGRTRSLENWGYHKNNQQGDKRCANYRTDVIEKDTKICFSIRPVISCSPDCSATEMKTKNLQYHCMEKTQHAIDLQNRINKGAHPNLTQKSIDMSRPLEVPLACVA